jgi:PrtD family type I secretion system ABC transporter
MRNEQTNAAARRKNTEKLTKSLRGLFVFVFSMSGLINILALTGSFYMMQIYDRAIPSRNIPTLLALSGLAIGLYVFQGVFETIRSQILVRVGAGMDRQLAPLAHQVAIDMPRFGFSTSESLERGRDVDTVRGFLGSQGPMALFDLPWLPLYLIFVYALHPYLGALVIGGAVVLSMLAILTELLTRKLSGATHQAVIARNAISDSNTRNSEVLRAMGFSGRAVDRFTDANKDHLALQTRANDLSGTLSAVSRILRMILQSATLGLGAYLTIEGQMSGGAIIAASIASSRALAPVDMAIANWKNVVQARGAWARIQETMIALAEDKKPMDLPRASRSIKIEKLTVAAPASGRVLLTEITFEVKAGQALGIIGPSGGGKTTLVRALTGIWPSLRGSVRLDEAELTQWPEEMLGSMVGYLPQDVALLDGTIEENIARLDAQANSEAVVKAARAAGVHDMIVHMSDGYQTQVGSQGATLSAGQRQRIGLARALYNDPFIVVMDEPNSNLDGEGEQALTEAIKAVKARNGIAIMVAHRPSALAAVDFIAVIQQGKMVAYGSKDEILGQKQSQNQNQIPPAIAAKVTSPVTTDTAIDAAAEAVNQAINARRSKPRLVKV